jgi:leader peptidase (prepilin peptidase) / N-methyltransferase
MSLLSAPFPGITALAVVLAFAGAAWGIAADRLATRWPEHDEAEGFLPGRRPGWRTVVVAAFGAVGLGVLPSRFDEPLHLVVFGAYLLALTVLLATDLDQRLLPGEITLPMIPLALVFAISGQNPLVGDGLVLAVVAAVAIPAVLYLPSLLFGPGAFGRGDVNLLVSVGLVSGAYRALAGTFVGIIVAGIVTVALLATRRVGLRTYIPYGPFLILGALWAILLRS